MKKEYGKPLLYIEDFTINQHIATCIMNSGAGHYDGECSFTVKDDDEEEIFVYYYQNIRQSICLRKAIIFFIIHFEQFLFYQIL